MKKRVAGFDILKVLAAYTVVLIHTSVPNMALRDFCLCWLPPANAVFGLMSGCLLWEKMMNVRAEPVNWFVGRVLSLVIPYLVWEFLYVCANVSFDAFRGDMAGLSWQQVVGIVFAGNGSVQLWFVIDLFYAQCFFAFLALLIRKPDKMFVGVFAVSVFMLFLYKAQPDSFIRKFLFLSGYCGSGMVLAALFSYHKNVSKVAFAAVTTAVVFIIAFVGSFKPILWLAGSCAIGNFILGEKINLALSKMSGYTMGVYLVHVFVCRVSAIFWQKIPAPHLQDAWCLPVAALGSFLISILIVHYLSRFQWLWGGRFRKR